MTLSRYRHGKHKSLFAGSSSYSTIEDAGEDLEIGPEEHYQGIMQMTIIQSAQPANESYFLLRFWRTLVFCGATNKPVLDFW